jgi:hypothetical protein
MTVLRRIPMPRWNIYKAVDSTIISIAVRC